MWEFLSLVTSLIPSSSRTFLFPCPPSQQHLVFAFFLHFDLLLSSLTRPDLFFSLTGKTMNSLQVTMLVLITAE
jgi:hypothetical protein